MNKMGNKRNFGGKKYTANHVKRTKQAAQRKAQKLRKAGVKTRVIKSAPKSMPAEYYLYTTRK